MADDLIQWLGGHDLGKYHEAFVTNEIDLSTLPLLTEEDLIELGLPLGARRKLQAAIGQLPQSVIHSSPASAHSSTPLSISENSLDKRQPEGQQQGLAAWERQPDARKPATRSV